VIGKSTRWLFLVLGLTVLGESASAQTLLDNYPGAELVKESGPAPGNQRIVLGALEKIQNHVEPEVQKFVSGDRYSFTYRLSEARRTGQVSDFFRDQIVARGQLMFECHGRRCGSSNYWANGVFRQAILYGPEQYQHYLAARFEGQTDSIALIYVAERGTGDIYLQLEVIEVQTPGERVEPDTISAALTSQGRYLLMDDADDKTVNAIVQLLARDEGMVLWVVGHSYLGVGESIADAMQRSMQEANAYIARLRRAGANPDQLQGYGVGPLVPLDTSSADRLELVLQRRAD